MNCERVEDLLSAYLDNALAHEEWQEVTAHLTFCKECSAMLAEFSRNDALISRLPRINPDLALRNRIFASPEYLELTGTFDVSGVAQKNWTVPELPAKSFRRNIPDRPQLVALPGGRDISSILPVNPVQHRQQFFPFYITSRKSRILLTFIAAMLILFVSAGSLILPKILFQQKNGINGGAPTPPSSQVGSTHFPNKGFCPPHDIGNSQISNLLISNTFPFTMKLNQSYVIEVSIVPVTEQGCISRITVETTKTIVTKPTSFETPGATLQDALGPGLKPFATATLYAGTFKVEPSEPQERLLNQSIIVWDWNITPQQSGQQIISVEIQVHWRALKDDGTGTPMSYVIGNPQLNVQIEENSPSFDWNPVYTYVLGVVLSGVLLSLFGWFGTQIGKGTLEKNKRKTSKKSSERRNRNLKSAS